MLKIVRTFDADNIEKKIIANGGFCITNQSDKSKDTKCMCQNFKSMNTECECKCGMYAKIEVLNY